MTRRRIAFFDYADVFEDFYPHYGVDQQTFATTWSNTGNHAFLSLIQRKIGDVTWYILSLNPELAEAQHKTVGCRVKFLRSPWLHRGLWKAFYEPSMAWRWRSAYRRYATVASYLAVTSRSLLKTLREDRPEIFFVQSYSSGRFDVLLWFAHVLGVPLIVYHSGGLPAGYLGKTIRRWTLPRADRIIVSSRDEFEMLIRRYRIDNCRLRIVLTPIDTEIYRPMKRADKRRYILFAGRLNDEVKRVSAIIQAFASVAAQHADVDLLIAGDGGDAPKLKALATQCSPGRVRFLGWVADAEAKAQLYSDAECLVLASAREGFPTVVGEAMACGTPVISSRVGGVGELVIEDRTGWLFEPGDDRALAERMSYVMAHPEAVASMRPQARKVAESRVSPEIIGAALKECFNCHD